MTRLPSIKSSPIALEKNMTDTADKEKLSPNYDNRLLEHLKQAIEDYLQWMKSVGYTRNTRKNYQAQLNQFLCFSKNTTISWQQIFTSNSLDYFKKITEQSSVPAINGLSRYLFSQGKIEKPLAQRAQPIDLPQIYEDYLSYQQTHRQATARLISSIKRVLLAFDQYLQSHKIELDSLKIQQVDAFLSEFLRPLRPPRAESTVAGYAAF